MSQKQTCRLCRKERPLRNSHFMPAAFYRHLGLDETGTFQNKALLRLTKDKLAHVPKHVTKHLLCNDCEQLFNKGGEGWVSRFGFQPGRDFLLQDLLISAESVGALSTGKVHHLARIEAIQWQKLAYFALSIFWRGAADSWTDDEKAPPFIEMDDDLQENLRRFLLGERDYPGDMMLMVKVASGRSSYTHLVSFPSKGTMEVPGRRVPQFSFIIPGVIFTLVPQPEPEWVKQGCLIRGEGHPVLMMNSDDLFIQEQLKLALSAEPSPKVLAQVRKIVSMLNDSDK